MSALTFVVLSTLGIAAVAAREVVIHGLALANWDLLFDSAWLAVIAGLWLSRGLPEHFATMIDRLTNRGAFTHPDGAAVAPDELTAVRAERDAVARRYERRAGLATGGVIALLFVLAKTSPPREHSTLPDLMISMVAAACVGGFGGFHVGKVIGRMLAYGLLGRDLTQRGISFRVIPGHVDGAAGLKPFGDYYLYQSLLVAIPGVFLLTWSLLFFNGSVGAPYESWRPWYFVLLILTLCLEWVMFGAPLRRAHEAMRRRKRDSLIIADRITREIDESRCELREDLDLKPAQRSALRDRVDELKIVYRDIEKMPTWPLDGSMRRQITLGNVAVLAPLVIHIAEATIKTLSSG